MSASIRSEALAKLSDAPIADVAKNIIRDALEDLSGHHEDGSSEAVFLSSVSVEGFRGVGEERVMNLHPGPGLTLVVGRNGSGKSSFAEGIEQVLTGANLRWARRTTQRKDWEAGFRNLHHSGNTRIELAFNVAGRYGETVVATEWSADAQLEEAVAFAQHHGEKRTDLAGLGWDRLIENSRPILSYNEMGSIIDQGPSALYQSLASILGIDAIVDASEAVRQQRLEITRAVKRSSEDRIELESSLEEVDDDRARLALSLLSDAVCDFDALTELASGDPLDDLAPLRAISGMSPPDSGDVVNRLAKLEAANSNVAELGIAGGSEAEELAELLTSALDYHAAHPSETCPICGTEDVLGGSWRERTTSAVGALHNKSEDYVKARAAVDDAINDLRSLFPASATTTELLDVSAVEAALDAWHSLMNVADWGSIVTDGPSVAADAIEAIKALQTAATAQLEHRQASWLPVANRISAWIEGARPANEGRERLGSVKEAEGWLAVTIDEMRNARFRPVKEDAKRVWEALCINSSVTLEDAVLAGSPARPRIDLEVHVDGSEGSALGVMSQGELHSLALSLFLPRAARPESPFRFIIIDDPVQAMDPVKVEGLAQVLSDVGRTHQVVVFTHDDRLRTAIWRLGLPARVLEVTRREGSKVDLKEVGDRASGLLDDASAIAKTPDVPEAVALATIALFCRDALEVVCHELVWLRSISEGRSLVETEEQLTGKLTRQLFALAVLDDAGRAGEILGNLKHTHGDWAADVFRAVVESVHRTYEGSIGKMIADTRRLCAALREAR